MDTLAFGYILPTTGRIRDFNPLETCAARRTTKKARGVHEYPSGLKTSQDTKYSVSYQRKRKGDAIRRPPTYTQAQTHSCKRRVRRFLFWWRCFSESSFILFLLSLNIRIIIFSRTHPCRQNSLVRDASLQDFSSLQTESPRQGCIAPGFFILADRISSSGMHRPKIFHPCRQNLLVRDTSPQDFSSLQTEFPRQGYIAPGFFIPADRISSSGIHRPRIFHPCRQNFLVRDASSRDFSSLQTESPRQGCIAPGFFIPADRISSAGMHRPGIVHPCRQNLLGRDASPQDFSSLQTKFPCQGCIVPGFFILADRIPSSGMHRPGIFHPYRQNLLGRDASPRHFSSLQTESPRQGCIVSAIMPQACRAPPQSAELTSIHLNACRAYPDKAGSSDFQTAGFHSR